MTDSKDLSFYMNVDVVKSSDVDNEDWIFEGLASTSNLDLFGDVVYPESFQNSIDFFKSNGKIFYNHNYARKDVPMEAQTPIGTPIDATIKEDGLYIKAALNKSHPLAQKIWNEFLTNPDPKFRGQIGLSIGAKALGQPRREYSPSHGKIVNYLPDLLLYEVSMTPTPVNPDTKTWVSVIKSVMDNSEAATEDEIIEVHPDDVVFDKERNLLVVKSTIEREDGTKSTIEQYINVKEDVIKSMDKDNDKDKLGGLNPEDANKDSVTPDAPAQDSPDATAPADDTSSPADDAVATPTDDLGDTTPTDGVDGAPTDEAAPTDGAPDEGGALADGGDADGGGLADLFGGDTGGDPAAGAADGDPAVDPGQDMDSASSAMVLDKLDTIQDSLVSMASDVATLVSKQQGGVVEGSTEAPVDNTIVKGVEGVQLKPFYEEEGFKDLLTSVIKSVIEEKVVPVLVQKEMVQKSTDSIKEPEVVLPKVQLSTGNVQEDNAIIIKSAYNGEPIELDRTILKGMLQSFISIKGSGLSHSVARGDVIAKAEKELGITSNQFRRLVQDYTNKDTVTI